METPEDKIRKCDNLKEAIDLAFDMIDEPIEEGEIIIDTEWLLGVQDDDEFVRLFYSAYAFNGTKEELTALVDRAVKCGISEDKLHEATKGLSMAAIIFLFKNAENFDKRSLDSMK